MKNQTIHNRDKPNSTPTQNNISIHQSFHKQSRVIQMMTQYIMVEKKFK